MHLTRYDSDTNPPETTVSPSVLPGIGLYGRRTECQALDRLVADVRAGQSRALILRGGAGVGKSVLRDYLAGRASGSGCRVARVVGVPSEMELAFAGLHQLCAPLQHSQWLDPDSAQALAFAARHLAAAPVAVVLAFRQPGGERELTGLPELPVGGLADCDAQALRAQVAADPHPSRLIPGADV